MKAYTLWTTKFREFTRDKTPASVSAAEVKAYLTYLAVKCQVSAATQNQAFDALLFLFRQVLKEDFGNHRDNPRARRTKYLPAVLSRQEIEAVLQPFPPPSDLVGKLLYGCGLRLFEGLKLRVHHFNFAAGLLTIPNGKGKKDRTVPLRQAIVPALQAQLEGVMQLHAQDSAAGYAGVFMEGLLEKKYPAAPRELGWQWFCPAKTLTLVPVVGKYRRYQLHESHVQQAIRAAVRRAKLLTRVSAPTFGHSLASHLLQANYDLHTIQELLGHAAVRTTMIYTHTI
ncbi:MAG TPA: integron integrase [Candidatus Binatia bacterium]|nr:integron integrase [Candidatus Binatia bacterium]